MTSFVIVLLSWWVESPLTTCVAVQAARWITQGVRGVVLDYPMSASRPSNIPKPTHHQSRGRSFSKAKKTQPNKYLKYSLCKNKRLLREIMPQEHILESEVKHTFSSSK